MKRLYTFLLLFIFSGSYFHSNAQNITIDVVNESIQALDNSGFVTADAILTNNSNNTISLEIERSIISGQDTWATGMCINDICYDVSKDKVTIQIGPNETVDFKSRFLLLDLNTGERAEVSYEMTNSENNNERIVFTTYGVNGNQPTSTSDLYDEQLKLFPNPAHDFLTLDVNGEIDYVNIYNNQGQLLYTQTSNQTTIDISNLKKGLHVVQVKLGNKESTTWFVKL